MLTLPSERADRSPWARLTAWWSRLTRLRSRRSRIATEEARLKFIHGRFREILNLNDSLLRLFADVQEKASGRTAFSFTAMTARLRQGLLDGFVLAKDLNQLSAGKYPELYDLLERLQAEIDAAPTESDDAILIPLDGLRREHVALAGSKMAILGELAHVGLAVPEGFVVTTAGFRLFMGLHELDQAARRLEAVYEAQGYNALDLTAQELMDRIMTHEVPPVLADVIRAAYARIAGENRQLMAVRSSAVGEDSALVTHAGQYLTLLQVKPEELVDAYRRVLASAFTPRAVVYRYQHGLTYHEAAMAVGFLKMVSPRVSGVMFTRDFRDPAASCMRISFVEGVGDQLVSGQSNAREITVERPRAGDQIVPGLNRVELETLVSTGECLERHFGSPQDIEWAFDERGTLVLLQSRPMVEALAPSAPPEELSGVLLASGGQIACPGIGRGFVHKVEPNAAPMELPEGSVLVLRHASASLAFLFPKCFAVLAETGSPSSHMAVLCREAGLPAVVGLPGLFDRFQGGEPVIVDGALGRVLAGTADLTPSRSLSRGRLQESPAARRLRDLERWITPLHLTDPSAENFRAGECRTLHDLVRFVHEKLYTTMFDFGERAARTSARSWKLEVKLPMEVLVADLGGGLKRTPAVGEKLGESDLASLPFRVLLEGMKDPRIDWTKPRTVSGAGFMSVVGAGLTGPPPEGQALSRPSFAVLAHQYLSFSVRAGYHFSVIEAVCSAIENKNFIQYRFGGGGAGEERRVRRASFLWQVLSRLGFSVKITGDLVTARVLKAPESETRELLRHLGRLTLCSRQLDMLMDTDDSPQTYAFAFLEGRFDQF